MRYTVNNTSLQYEAAGKKVHGDDVVLVRQAIDITSTTAWHALGYTVAPLFTENIYDLFMAGAATLLRQLWQKAGLSVDANFPLHQYHRVAPGRNVHLAAVNYTKLVHTALFPVAIRLLERRISEICNEELVVLNPFDNQSVFHFRVIRPQRNDNNPLHRDVWLEDYKDCINLYIPIAGSDAHSSLVVTPGSHLWSESKVERTLYGAEINGVKYNVPAVTSVKEELTCVRPNPGANEVLVFSPYLIHGGAENLNADTTRISIEVRLWRK